MYSPVLELTPSGLYCPAGDFYVDPSRAVDTALVTHAHSDHARRGSRRYFCAATGLGVLKSRLGASIDARPVSLGERLRFGSATVSFHPAGHILGSAQVRVEADGQVWVVSGDYKREPDPTCEAFETVECDVFLTEATFGTPAFQWRREKDLGADIHEWWQTNALQGRNCVLFAYSLGKAQRILGELLGYARKPVLTHPSVSTLTDCYRREGVKLADTRCLSEFDEGPGASAFEGELILAPPSILKSPLGRLLDRYVTAFASGWMQSGSRGYDRGFVMSDHADWNDLVRTVQESRAKRVYVLHRGKGALVKHLRTLGIDAQPVSELTQPSQLAFTGAIALSLALRAPKSG